MVLVPYVTTTILIYEYTMKRILLTLGICLSMLATAYSQAPGDIIITEFIADPSAVADSKGEYIELYNKRSVSFDLEGFKIKDDGTDSHTIVGSLVIPAESFIVLGINDTTAVNNGVTVNYVYTGFGLTNSTDEIVLTTAIGTEIARVNYTTSTSGKSRELDALSDVGSNGTTDFSNYSNSTTAQGSDFGSPGSAGSTNLTETPTIRFTKSSETFAETGGAVNIGVILEDADGNTVNVDVVYSEPKSSTEPSDFTSINTVSLSFTTAASGDETKTAAFTITNDTDYEGAEFGFFDLSNLSTTGATVLNAAGDSTYTLKITGNDAPNVVINEVNPDPDADANGDGINSTGSDEFVEIFNNESVNIDISNWKLIDKTGTIHLFSSTTLVKAKSAFVIFDDSGTPVGSFGGSTVVTSSSNLSLNNSSEKIVLITNNGERLDSVEYGTGPSNVSLTRNPDGTGAFVDHTTANASLTISPGTKVDGTSFTTDIVIGGTAGWRMMSVPMENYDITQLSDDTPIQGVTGGSNTGSAANIYYYDDSGAFEVPTNTTTQYPEGYGFILYFYNNDDNSSAHLPVTLDVSGSEPSSDVAVTLSTTATSGSYYTLVGNPFASNYNLNSITDTNGDGIQNNVHFWDNASGSYKAIDRTGPSVVSSWQGFWVEVTNNGSETTAINIPTSGKTFSAISDFYLAKQNTQRGDIEFSLTSKTTTDNALRLSFRNDATLEFDKADASKLNPLIGNYATMAFKSNGRLKSVESLPYNLEHEISVSLEEQLVGVDGELTLDWSGLESIQKNLALTLNDFKTGASINMRNQSEYSFYAKSLTAKQKSPLSIISGVSAVPQKSKSTSSRFSITITPNTSVSNEDELTTVDKFRLEQNYPNPFNPATTIKYAVAANGPVNITIYNVMGQKVAELLNTTKNAGTYQVTWNATAQASGIYYYRLTAPGQVLTRQMTLIK